jgi:hypothetical protein
VSGKDSCALVLDKVVVILPVAGEAPWQEQVKDVIRAMRRPRRAPRPARGSGHPDRAERPA